MSNCYKKVKLDFNVFTALSLKASARDFSKFNNDGSVGAPLLLLGHICETSHGLHNYC